jgi:N-glycosylase/DNA lyase
MLIQISQPFDLFSTLNSGQSFRWEKQGEWVFGVVFENIVKIKEVRQGVEFFSSPDDEDTLMPLVMDYLGLSTDIYSIYESISIDRRIESAIDRYRGMRLLRQDPWECLISFICSSASNIKRISRNVESICDSYGTTIRLGNYHRNTFPTPVQLSQSEASDLRELGLGYRADFITATARTVANGDIDLFSLREESYQESLDCLTSLDGVGDKVANCVMLFSLDKYDAFPVDVWINRVLHEWYLDGGQKKMSLPKLRSWAQHHFGPYAGYANHYLFHSRRLQGR